MAFDYFGTITRGMFTMFEITFGDWVPCGRVLKERIDEWFGLFILVYRMLVGFAMMKVITGIFLHETFKVAATDDDIMIMEKVRQTKKHVKKMQLLFEEADDSGDGV